MLKTFQIDSDFSYLLLIAFVVLVQSLLFLLQNHLFVLEVHHIFIDLLKFIVLVNQNCLFLDPLSVQLVAPDFQFLTLSSQIYQFVFIGVFTLVVGFAHQFVMKFIQSSNLMLFFLVDVVTLFDLDFIGDDQVFFIVLLCQGFIFFLPQQVDLTFGVELIDFDSGYLVHDVLQFHLFLLNIVTNFMSLFEKIASCFLDSGMFTFLIDEIFI